MSDAIKNWRRSPRVPVQLLVLATQHGESWTAEIEDLGPGGCLLHSPRPLPLHSSLRLTLRCEDVPSALNVIGEVVWAVESRTGIAFTPGQASKPQEWFKLLLAARPQLAKAAQRVPLDLSLSAPLYFQPAPRQVFHLTFNELLLLRQAENGIAVKELLQRAGIGTDDARAALMALFEKDVLTLSLGAAADPWRWRALAPQALQMAQAPSPSPCAPPPASAAEPSRTPPPLPRHALSTVKPPPLHPPAPPPAAEEDRQDDEVIHLPSAPTRGRAAKNCFDEAEQAAKEGRTRAAITLLRQALMFAPDDREIADRLEDLTGTEQRALYST